MARLVDNAGVLVHEKVIREPAQRLFKIIRILKPRMLCQMNTFNNRARTIQYRYIIAYNKVFM